MSTQTKEDSVTVKRKKPMMNGCLKYVFSEPNAEKPAKILKVDVDYNSSEEFLFPQFDSKSTREEENLNRLLTPAEQHCVNSNLYHISKLRSEINPILLQRNLLYRKQAKESKSLKGMDSRKSLEAICNELTSLNKEIENSVHQVVFRISYHGLDFKQSKDKLMTSHRNGYGSAIRNLEEHLQSGQLELELVKRRFKTVTTVGSLKFSLNGSSLSTNGYARRLTIPAKISIPLEKLGNNHSEMPGVFSTEDALKITLILFSTASSESGKSSQRNGKLSGGYNNSKFIWELPLGSLVDLEKSNDMDLELHLNSASFYSSANSKGFCSPSKKNPKLSFDDQELPFAALKLNSVTEFVPSSSNPGPWIKSLVESPVKNPAQRNSSKRRKSTSRSPSRSRNTGCIENSTETQSSRASPVRRTSPRLAGHSPGSRIVEKPTLSSNCQQSPKTTRSSESIVSSSFSSEVESDSQKASAKISKNKQSPASVSKRMPPRRSSPRSRAGSTGSIDSSSFIKPIVRPWEANSRMLSTKTSLVKNGKRSPDQCQWSLPQNDPHSSPASRHSAIRSDAALIDSDVFMERKSPKSDKHRSKNSAGRPQASLKHQSEFGKERDKLSPAGQPQASMVLNNRVLSPESRKSPGKKSPRIRTKSLHEIAGSTETDVWNGSTNTTPPHFVSDSAVRNFGGTSTPDQSISPSKSKSIEQTEVKMECDSSIERCTEECLVKYVFVIGCKTFYLDSGVISCIWCKKEQYSIDNLLLHYSTFHQSYIFEKSGSSTTSALILVNLADCRPNQKVEGKNFVFIKRKNKGSETVDAETALRLSCAVFERNGNMLTTNVDFANSKTGRLF